MSAVDETRSVERQRFFDGQRLFVDDVGRIEEFDREMRWLHNRSLHQPGIGNGFAVSGRKGDREVGIAPGYAIDDLGREIVLTSPRAVAVPPVAGDGHGGPQRFALTVRYPDDDELEEVEFRQGICGTRGAVRLREEPVRCWVALHPDGTPATAAGDILSGRAIVLGEVSVRDCKLDEDRTIAARRNARPPAQPHIACGLEDPVMWEEWNPGEGIVEDGVDLAQPLRAFYRIAGGLKATVHTDSAGFRTTPGYFARIDGTRTFTVAGEGGIEGGGDVVVVLDGQLSIVDPTPTSFGVLVIVLAFTANQEVVPEPEPGPVLGILGPLLGGGFDVSALMFARGERAAEPAAEPAAAAAGGSSGLIDLIGTAWTIGWMGVEG